MKNRLFLLLAVAALAGAAGWFARSFRGTDSLAGGVQTGQRRILYYQSAMHPWIRSDQPGKCTICGMDLAPVYEGDTALAAPPGRVTLSSNSLTVVNVQTAPATRKPLVRSLRVAGTINDNESRRRVLSAYTDGRLDRLHVNYVGAEVRAGEPLMLLYSPTLQAAVREYVTLMRPGAGAATAAGPLAAAAASRLLQLGLTAGQVERLPATFTETNLHVEILSPLSGTVVAKDVSEGQTVTSGQRLLELADFSTMWFQFDAYERDLDWLRPGQTIEITSPALPGVTFTNTIAFVDPNFDPATRTTRVRVELPNPLRDTPAGPERPIRNRVYAEGRVEARTPETLTVPRSAVLDGGQPLVFVEQSGGTYQARPVTIGRPGDTDVEVLSGLSEGDRVVTQGALLLDAQAQLNALSHPAEPATPPAAPATLLPGEALTSAQLQSLRNFLELADAVRESLSADALERFNELAPRLHAEASRLPESFEGSPGWQPRVREVAAASHLDPAPDLLAARKEFHPLSTALVALGRPLRTLPDFAGLKLYECPMAKRAFPGAPSRAGWLQLSGPIRNPYFGQEMLDCGTEVRP